MHLCIGFLLMPPCSWAKGAPTPLYHSTAPARFASYLLLSDTVCLCLSNGMPEEKRQGNHPACEPGPGVAHCWRPGAQSGHLQPGSRGPQSSLQSWNVPGARRGSSSATRGPGLGLPLTWPEMPAKARGGGTGWQVPAAGQGRDAKQTCRSCCKCCARAVVSVPVLCQGGAEEPPACSGPFLFAP